MNVRTIEDGEIICEPGIYDMSIEWYHQQCCDGPSISSGGIRAIIKSPAEYWRTSHLNPNRVEEDGKEAYTLGRAAHHLLLGEKNFARHFRSGIDWGHRRRQSGRRADVKLPGPTKLGGRL